MNRISETNENIIIEVEEHIRRCTELLTVLKFNLGIEQPKDAV